MVNGLSKWTHELKLTTKKGGIDRIESRPIMCDCGYEHPIGGSGTGVASFFYINNEWICAGCGLVLSVTLHSTD